MEAGVPRFINADAIAAGLAAFAPAQAQTTTYTLDPTHTFVTWEALHFGTSTNRGRFDKKEGKVTIDRTAKTGSVDITIDMAARLALLLREGAEFVFKFVGMPI